MEFLCWKYYFEHTTFLYLSTRSSGHHQSFRFTDFRFSRTEFQSQQKLAKKVTHFTIQFHPKKLNYFTKLNSFDIENNMLAQHSQKPFWLYKFSSKHVSVWCQKKKIALHYFLMPEPHSWSTLKANVCIFLYIAVRSFLLGGWVGGRMNDFLKVARSLGLVNCYTIFYFNWNFRKFN